MLESTSQIYGGNLTQDSHSSLNGPPPSLIAGYNELERVKNCGKFYDTLHCPNCNSWYLKKAKCRTRICPKCSWSLTFKFIQRYRNIKFQWPLFLTLTLKTGSDLKERYETALKSFRLFRKRIFHERNGRPFKLYRGIFAFEITKSKDGLWGVHVHILTNATWLKWDECKEFWQKITGDSFVTKPERSKNLLKTVKEVCKGTIKTSDGKIKSFSDSDLIEIATVIRHRRMIMSWGLSRWWSLLVQEQSFQPKFYCAACGTQLNYWSRMDEKLAKIWVMFDNAKIYDPKLIEELILTGKIGN